MPIDVSFPKDPLGWQKRFEVLGLKAKVFPGVCMRFGRIIGSILFGAILGLAGQAGAQTVRPVQVQATGVAELADTLKIAEVIEIMRLEGVDYGAQMEEEFFAERGGAAWKSVVDLIYDGPTMQVRFQEAFAKQLAGHDADIPAIQSFFGADLGQRILALEIEARRSLMDEAVEDAAKAFVEDMMAEGAPRFDALQAFSDTNDLIEMNVSGALNSNLAFFQGLAEVDGGAPEMTQDDMLMMVWGQEPEIRAETEGWIYPYLSLAYGPLSDAELEAYIAFSKTGPGQVLNSALFGAFDVVFSTISRDLGRAVAKQMMGQDI